MICERTLLSDYAVHGEKVFTAELKGGRPAPETPQNTKDNFFFAKYFTVTCSRVTLKTPVGILSRVNGSHRCLLV